MQRTQIYLAPEQHHKLVQEARASGISLAELFRRIVDQHLDERQPNSASQKDILLQFIGLGASGLTDVSERHDDYLGQALP